MLKVLIVEDEQYIAQGLSMLIDWESCGYEIAGTVYNGQDAIDFLQDTQVDLILSDIKMPVMDGCEATRQIRHLNREDAKTIPILAATANAFTEDIALTKKAGMNAHISKPIDFEVLKITIARLLQE